MFAPEHTNYLWQCLKRRYWADSARFLARPLKTSLYRIRRSVVHRPGPSLNPLPDVGDLPVTALVPVVFSARFPNPGEFVDGVDRALRDADQQLAGTFRLAGGVPRRIDFDNLSLLQDPEDLHSYHRLYWAVRYAQAAAFGHRTAVHGLETDLDRWLEARPRTQAIASAAYTVSERIASLAEVLFWSASRDLLISRELVLQLKRQIWQDTQCLYQSVEYKLGIHNHLLNNARALYIGSAILPEAGDAALWRDAAFALWDRQFPVLVLDDGTFNEQSSHYHLLLCRTGIEYFLAAKTCGRQLPDGFREKLRKMFQLANDLLRADGSLARFGDNSPDHPVEDLWGLLQAASSHSLLQETPRHAVITPLTLYYGGNGDNALAGSASVAARLYPQGGFAFLKSSRGAELAIHADSSPEVRAHGDCGRGSFELWWGGRIVIREPGCFLRPGNAESGRYRTAEAQNVTCINELAPVLSRDDQQRLPKWYWRESSFWTQLNGSSVQFESSAFRRTRAGMSSKRRWSCGENGSVLFEEDLDGYSGVVRFRSLLYLGGGNWGPLEGGRSRAVMECSGHLDGTLRMTMDLPDGLTATLEQARFTPEYGVQLPATVIAIEGEPALPLRWTVLCELVN